MTSSERSLRLCAFSVFRAKICHATRFRDDQSRDGLSPKAAHASRRWRPFGVQKPFGCDDSDDRVEKATGLANNLGQPFVVSVGESAETASARSCQSAISRAASDDLKRFLIQAHHAAPAFSMASAASAADLLVCPNRHSTGSKPFVPGLALRGRCRAGARFGIVETLSYLREN